MQNIAQNNYLKAKVENSSPIGRVVILFEACEKFMVQAREALVSGNKVVFTDKMIKSQNIVRELRNALNLDVDEKIAGGFYNLYTYVLKQLMNAVRIKNIAPLNAALKITTQLKDAWKEADKKGLGQDVQRVETRSAGQANKRTMSPAQSSYSSMSEGLNLFS